MPDIARVIANANRAIERYDEGRSEGPLQDIENVIDDLRDTLADAVSILEAQTNA
jgi:hypothetical protein